LVRAVRSISRREVWRVEWRCAAAKERRKQVKMAHGVMRRGRFR
jgi:hypothetical protein